MSGAGSDRETRASGGLQRVVGLPSLVLYGLGTTIGAGIYALTGVIAGRAGMLSPSAFLLASSLAAFTALSFAELSSRFPRAGGEAVYVSEGWNRPALTTAVGLMVALAGMISAATVSTAFLGYLAEFVSLPRGLALVAVILIVGAIAGGGIRESVFLASLMTLAEVGGLVLILVYTGQHWSTLPARSLELVPGLDGQAWWAVGSAAILAFYGFLGFEDMVNIAEEVKQVRKNLPRAILLVLAITTLLYAATITAAVLVVSPAELAASPAPLALVFERCGGSGALLSAIALFAMLNGALVQIVKSSRVLYGLAREKAIPAVLGRIHKRTRTPLVATTVITGGVIGLASLFPLERLAAWTSLITLVTFAVTNGALVRIKLRDGRSARGPEYPLWVPVVGAVVSSGLALFELIPEAL